MNTSQRCAARELFNWASRVEEERQGRGEDRVYVVDLGRRLFAVVADGAGGVSGGADAAEIVRLSLAEASQVAPPSWVDWMALVDQKIATSPARGLAAAVVVDLRAGGEVRGVSVGDCEARIFGKGEPRDLTAGQVRKPLLGSGNACPTFFSAHVSVGEMLVLGSDGLWKYANRTRLLEATRIRPLESLVEALINGVRLPNGKLQDDAAVVACELSA